jgi:hypothetical protein
VATWRRHAIRLFPQLHRELTKQNYTVYLLFFELKPMLRNALDSQNTELVSRIFWFAEWCASQTAQQLWNAAGVAFYEHLFDYPSYSEYLVRWLSPKIVSMHWDLWEATQSAEEWSRVSPLLAAKRLTAYGRVRPTKELRKRSKEL